MSSPAQQAADELRWWLRLPPINLIVRQDHIRFRHAIYLIIHQAASVLYDANNLPDAMHFPSKLSGAQLDFDELARGPFHAGTRLWELASTADEALTWQRASALITDVLAITEMGHAEPSGTAHETASEYSPKQMFSRAEALAVRLHSLVGIEAVALGGSLARGTADTQSDIDIHVFCAVIPSGNVRRNLIASWPDVQQSPRIEPACDTVWMDGVMVHIRYWHSEEVDRMFALYPALPSNMLLAEELQIGKSLFDPKGRIRLWQQMIEQPPRALVETMMDQARRRLSSFRTQWHKACSLHDPVHQYCLINQAVHDWLVALYIRNGRFMSTPRWTHRDMVDLSFTPDDLDNRLVDLVDAIEEAGEANMRFGHLEALWEELSDL